MSEVYVHPKGINESEQVGEGTRIWAFAHVMRDAVVGQGCNIGEGAFVESGAVVGNHVTVKNGVCIWNRVTLGDHVFLGPHAVLTNDHVPRSHPEYRSAPEDWRATEIQEGASVGANATIVCGNTLGPWCVIGAGAVVARNVPAHALMVGNPARRIAWVCRCTARLGTDLRCPQCRLTYREHDGGLEPVES